MTEQPALVVAVDAQGIQVRIQNRTAACTFCAGGCRLKWLAKVSKVNDSGVYLKKTQITLQRDQRFEDIKPGENVLLGFEENRLLAGALTVYIMPLLIFFLMLQAAKSTFDSEPAAIFAGFAGLLSGLAGLKLLDRSDYSHWWTVTLQRFTSDKGASLINSN